MAEYAAKCVAAGAASVSTHPAISRSRPRTRRRTNALAKENASVTAIIRAAIDASGKGDKAGGINKADRRFRWHALGAPANSPPPSDDEDTGAPASVVTDTRRTVPLDLYRVLLVDGVVLREAAMAIQARVAAAAPRSTASVVIAGSTGMRLERTRVQARGKVALDAGAFHVSDIDIDVYISPAAAEADPNLAGAVIGAIDRACTDIVRDRVFASECEGRLADNGWTTRNQQMRSRVYVTNAHGAAIAIEVPALREETARIRPGPVFATRNDTLDGITLHRIRLAVTRCDDRAATDGGDRSRDLPRSVPLIDIKTRIGAAPATTDRRVAGLRVRVPTAKESIAELERLLSREYDNVDATKDEHRTRQLRAFQGP